ncbi:COG4315 family predicted lipoprotein [Actinacidiphila rubida]|uniref:COG4315 family predicted lipoprotein n=1 Tax=Actinacidiphila rubida TaxID=310780 RepID=UPI0008499F90
MTTKSGPLGTVLVNSKGHTLYLFQGDKSSTSTCNGNCAKQWPPLTVSGNTKPTGSGGVDTSKLSTTTRSDGSKQVTYNGHPLYTFSGDSKAGQTNGQGLNAFGAKWYVVGTNGKQITKMPSSSSPPSGGGY